MATDHSTMEQKVQREIRFDLTSEEKDKMANQAGKLSKERDQLTDQLKAFSKEKRATIKDLQGQIDRLLDDHMKGYEMREVQVTEVLDWENKTVTTYYKEDKVDEREMHDAELQMKLKANPSRKVKKKATKKASKKTKAQKNPEQNLTPEELKAQEIQEIHKSETNKKSKVSSIDEARKAGSDDD